MIATGGRAAAPPIPGLAEAGYLTNETLFSLTELPRRLAVIGAGPIGCEMAQAFRRLGSEVTLFEAETHVLPREDPDAAAIVERQLVADGVQLVLCGHLTRVERRGRDLVLYCDAGGRHDLLAATRSSSPPVGHPTSRGSASRRRASLIRRKASS